MFRRITCLLFGGQEETPEEVRSGETIEEGWLLVTHREANTEVSSVENQDAEQANTHPSNPTVHEETDTNLETDISPVTRSSASQAEALAKVTHAARVQRAQALADRHHLSRNSIQRQNCARQHTQHSSSHKHSTYLHQPGSRSLSH